MQSGHPWRGGFGRSSTSPRPRGRPQFYWNIFYKISVDGCWQFVDPCQLPRDSACRGVCDAIRLRAMLRAERVRHLQSKFCISSVIQTTKPLVKNYTRLFQTLTNFHSCSLLPTISKTYPFLLPHLFLIHHTPSVPKISNMQLQLD